jgi:alanine racemase
VVAVRRLRAGETVSYNASWSASRDTTVATLGIGYADGVRRLLARSGDARVLLGGRRVPIVGRVTMDLTLVDAGDAAVQPGDVATLIGAADGGTITLAECAGWGEMLQHELLTGLGPRLPRVYK